MGSLAEAQISGFVCRMCSKLKKNVVHFYGINNRNLIKKIRRTLDIRIIPNDTLPKTICMSCVEAVESNYTFIRMARKNYKIQMKRRKLSQTTEST